MLIALGGKAVAAVLSNWHNVLRAINMASSKPTSPWLCKITCLIEVLSEITKAEDYG